VRFELKLGAILGRDFDVTIGRALVLVVNSGTDRTENDSLLAGDRVHRAVP
jgi:hypothetical protein